TFTYNTSSNKTLLTSVVDIDGKAITMTYDTNYTSQISKVTDPFGNSLHITYGTNAIISNLVDVINFTTTFQYTYDSYNIPLMTLMTNAYGPTTFEYQIGRAH